MRSLHPKTVCKMKLIVFFVLVCFAWSQADDPGCTLLSGHLKLKRGELFEIGEACLRFKCVENERFNVTTGCETRFRGVSEDNYYKQVKQLVENVRNGHGCYGISVPKFSP